MTAIEEFQLRMSFDNKYIPPEQDDYIYHYTSAQGFKQILFEDADKITLWASRYDCLNDASEGTIALKVYQEVCSKLKENNEITKEEYELFSKIKPPHTISLTHYKEDRYIITKTECDRFVCSFSENPDSLPMWNYYSKGNQYEGFNLGFDSDELKTSIGKQFQFHEAIVRIYPVVYNRKEQEEYISSLLSKIKSIYKPGDEKCIRYIISNLLLDWSLIFKSEYFQHEEEVRIVVDIAKRAAQKTTIPEPIKVNYRTNEGYLVPYVELKIDKYALSYVCLGPLQCNEEQKEQQNKILREMLNAGGYYATPKHSKIPVRF